MSDQSRTITLFKPIITHSGETREIVLKEPTAGSFIKHGEPFTVSVKDGKYEIVFDNKVTAAFLSEMSGIDPIILASIGPRDFFTMRHALVELVTGVIGQETHPTQQ